MTLYENLQLQVKLAQSCRVNATMPTGEPIEHCAGHECEDCVTERKARNELEAQPEHKLEQVAWVQLMRELRDASKA
jgi:hypothetical protein